MIGNDVVDLRLAKLQSNWQRPRFLAKLFSEKERELISSAEKKPQQVWRLWSMKEAVYKAHQRRFDLLPKFNPKAYECQLFSEEKGIVEINDVGYETTTVMKESYIYSEAIVAKSNFSTTSFFVVNTCKNYLKNELLKECSMRLKKPLPDFSIKKCANSSVPKIFLNERETNIVFSLTDHGRFSAFTVVL